MEQFTVGMRDCVVQTAPLAYLGTLIPILSTKVGNFVHVAQTAANLGEAELLRQKKGIRQVGKKDKEGKRERI